MGQYNHKGPYIRGRQEAKSEEEWEVRNRSWLEDGGRGQRPRNANSLEMGSCPWLQKEHRPPDIDFDPVRLILDPDLHSCKRINLLC